MDVDPMEIELDDMLNNHGEQQDEHDNIQTIESNEAWNA